MPRLSTRDRDINEKVIIIRPDRKTNTCRRLIQRIRRQPETAIAGRLKLTGTASRIDNPRRENRDVKTGTWSAKLDEDRSTSGNRAEYE